MIDQQKILQVVLQDLCGCGGAVRGQVVTVQVHQVNRQLNIIHSQEDFPNLPLGG